MGDKAHPSLLERDRSIRDATDVYDAQLALLDDLVNYGTNLIVSCLHTSRKRGRSLGDVMACGVLLKQIVQMLDGYAVLLRCGTIEPAHLQTRAILEASIQLEWLLSPHSEEVIEEKGNYFYVGSLRRDLEWARRSLPGGPEHADFFASLGDFAKALAETQDRLKDEAKRLESSVVARLSRPPLEAINAAFSKKRGNRKFDPPWYAVHSGHVSVKQLAESTNRSHEYSVFYSALSEVLHSSEPTRHVNFSGATVRLNQIRHLREADTSIRSTIAIVLEAYRVILSYYRPGQLDEMDRRYLRDWRDPFTNMKRIQYESSDSDPI